MGLLSRRDVSVKDNQANYFCTSKSGLGSGKGKLITGFYVEKGKSSLLFTHVKKKSVERSTSWEICDYSNGNASVKVLLFSSKLSERWFCRSDLSWWKQGSNYAFEIWTSGLFIIAWFKSLIYTPCSALKYVRNHFFLLSWLSIFVPFCVFLGCTAGIALVKTYFRSARSTTCFPALCRLTVVCTSRYAKPDLIGCCNFLYIFN